MRRVFWTATLLGIAMIAPVGARASEATDQQVAQEVADNLADNLKNYSVNVKVQDGTAWLSGSVTSDRQWNAAAQVARRTQGVQRVVNNLTIGSAPQSSGNAPSSLRQPTGSASRSPVVQAAMETPESSRQQYWTPGPLDDTSTAQPAAAQGSYDPRLMAASANYQAANAAYSQAAMSGPRSPAQQMPLPLAAAGGAGNSLASAQIDAEAISPPAPVPAMTPMGPGAPAPYRFDHPQMPGYAWPSYAAYPNYAAVTYPKQYSPTAWPYIGPFYPYPQVPLGWRKVTMEWKDGWWFLDFKDSH